MLTRRPIKDCFYSTLQQGCSKYRVVQYARAPRPDGTLRTLRQTCYSGVPTEEEAERIMTVLESIVDYLHDTNTFPLDED